MKLLLYCTKAKPYLAERLPFNDKRFYECRNKNDYYNLNGNIVAECDFEVEEIDTMALSEHIYDDYYDDNIDRISKESCLTCEQMSKYLGTTWDSIGYAIHIKNLHIFDEPRELGKTAIYNFNTQYIVDKAPQNMMKVYNQAGDCHILISIHPEWLCKILNGEKKIEVRKKVLKEMLK